MFSCCFPYLRPYVANKIESRSLSCAFLGYNSSHKGYKCLSSFSMMYIYINRDVVFDKQNFPFAPSKISSLKIDYASMNTTLPILINSPSQHQSTNVSLSHSPLMFLSLVVSSEHVLESTLLVSPLQSNSMIPSQSTHSTYNSHSSNQCIPESCLGSYSIIPSSSQDVASSNIHPMNTRCKIGILSQKPFFLVSLDLNLIKPSLVK